MDGNLACTFGQSSMTEGSRQVRKRQKRPEAMPGEVHLSQQGNSYLKAGMRVLDPQEPGISTAFRLLRD